MRFTFGWSMTSGFSLVLLGSAIIITSTQPISYSGWPPLVLGLIIMIGGIYTRFLSPPDLSGSKNSEVSWETSPSQKVPGAKSVIGFVLGAVGIALLIGSDFPLAYPTLMIIGGGYWYAAGVSQVWRNSLTKYYITSQQIIEKYELLSVRTKSMPRSNIQGFENNRSILERLLGVGHVKIESAGDSGTSRITARNIYDPDEFLHRIRD